MLINHQLQKPTFAIALFLVSHFSYTQTKKIVDPESAKEHFSHGNYVMALPLYKELVKQQPKSIDYNLKAGMCCLNTNNNKAQAIPYLELVCSSAKADAENFFNLGKAYQYGYRFDEAIQTYEKCIQLAKGDLIQRADRQIETCHNAKELIKYPLDVTFVNLGKQINSEYPDYNPFIPADESFLVFTSRKPEGAGGQAEIDGYFPSDIYISYPKEGVWQKPKNLGQSVNTRFDEQAVDLSSNGKTLIVYLDHIDSLGNIYYAENSKNIFSKLVRFENVINSGFETSGSITGDNSMVAFASRRPDGFGETDIYTIKKLPDGNWATPQLLGNHINTKYKEDFPHLSSDGKTLYFASQGHSSMGGFDIFKSRYDEVSNSWSAPQNIGYPINTTEDDLSISFTGDSCYAYLSGSRPGGFGNLDLYKLTLNQDKKRYSIISGYVTTNDTLSSSIKKQIVAIRSDNKELQKFTPVKSSGKYIMALTPGKYTIAVKAEGYEDYNLVLTVIDVPFQPEQKQDFQLSKIVNHN